MERLKILMIGGTGTISSAITRQLAESGHELWLLNRGTRKQEVPGSVKQVIADIDWTDCHPIKQVYMTYNCNTGQKMWDPMTAIQAVEGDGLFTLSERGVVTLTADAKTLFTPDPSGCCRYQKPGTPQWAASMLEKIRTFNKIKTIL